MGSNFSGNTIILAVPNDFGLPDCFRKNLEFLGFHVHLVKHDASKKLKISKKDLLIHLIRKFFFKDKSIKAERLADLKAYRQLEYLQSIKNADYALVIRPDLLSHSVLEVITNKAAFSVAYQWDGMDRFPNVKSRIRYFDRFFVFDSNDVTKYQKTTAITNFYFDYLDEHCLIKQDVFFLGTFMKDRMEDIAFLAENLYNAGLKTNINILYDKEKKVRRYRKYPINFIKKAISYEDAMFESKSSNILLDVENSIHKGLSLRGFEAIGFGKKLITNNKLITHYDFYNRNNIFLLNSNSPNLSNFLNIPYQKEESELIEKYSFTFWIQKVLTK